MFRTLLTPVTKSLVALLMVTLSSDAVLAQPPSSFADNNYEYNAYVYSYSAMVYSGGIASTMSGNTEEDDMAQFVDELTTSGFLSAYDAILDDDDTLWLDVVDDLELARFWCNTLIVFAEDSQSSTTVYNIKTLMRYLDIAIANAEKAAPQQKSRFLQRNLQIRF